MRDLLLFQGISAEELLSAGTLHDLGESSALQLVGGLTRHLVMNSKISPLNAYFDSSIFGRETSRYWSPSYRIIEKTMLTVLAPLYVHSIKLRQNIELGDAFMADLKINVIKAPICRTSLLDLDIQYPPSHLAISKTLSGQLPKSRSIPHLLEYFGIQAEHILREFSCNSIEAAIFKIVDNSGENGMLLDDIALVNLRKYFLKVLKLKNNRMTVTIIALVSYQMMRFFQLYRLRYSH